MYPWIRWNSSTTSAGRVDGTEGEEEEEEEEDSERKVVTRVVMSFGSEEASFWRAVVQPWREAKGAEREEREAKGGSDAKKKKKNGKKTKRKQESVKACLLYMSHPERFRERGVAENKEEGKEARERGGERGSEGRASPTQPNTRAQPFLSLSRNEKLEWKYSTYRASSHVREPFKERTEKKGRRVRKRARGGGGEHETRSSSPKVDRVQRESFGLSEFLLLSRGWEGVGHVLIDERKSEGKRRKGEGQLETKTEKRRAHFSNKGNLLLPPSLKNLPTKYSPPRTNPSNV